MNYVEKVLIVSLIVVWTAVFFKYEIVIASRSGGGSSGSGSSGSGSSGSGSSGSSGSGSSNRYSGGGSASSGSGGRYSGGGSNIGSGSSGNIGSRFSGGGSNSGSSNNRNSDSSGTRFRQRIQDTYHRIEDKIHPKPKVDPNVPVAPVPSKPDGPKIQPLPPFVPAVPNPVPGGNPAGGYPAGGYPGGGYPGGGYPGGGYPGGGYPGGGYPGGGYPGGAYPGGGYPGGGYPGGGYPAGGDKPKDGLGGFLKPAGGAFILSKLAKKIKGSSGYNSGGHHNYHSGLYHNYNYRPDRYRDIQGAVCTNNMNYDGITYGQFRCPVDGFDYSATMCCGPYQEQYCCTPAEAGQYGPMRNDYDYSNSYNKPHKSKGSGITSAIIVCLFLIICIIAGVLLFMYCKKRVYNKT